MFHGIGPFKHVSYDESDNDHVFLVPFIIILEIMEVNDIVTTFRQSSRGVTFPLHTENVEI